MLNKFVLLAFIFDITNKINDVNDKSVKKHYILDYFNNNNIKSKEIYNWLLNIKLYQLNTLRA